MHKYKYNRRIPLGTGKVLAFDQPADFFYRRGVARMDRNQLREAVDFYHQAIQKGDPDTDIKLSLAEALTRMNRYDESNEILFELINEDPSSESECYFLIGCNYVGLYEYDCASEVFERYQAVEPDEEFIENAAEMLAAMREEQEMDFFELCEREKISPDTLDICMSAEQYMVRGAYGKALEIYDTVPEKEKETPYVLNSRALSLFGLRKVDEAIQLALAVMEKDPNQLQACCNLVMFYNAADEVEKAKEQAKKIDKKRISSLSPQDLNRMAVAFVEVGFYEDAQSIYRILYEQFPYDMVIAHSYGVCLYELGQYQAAAAIYHELLKINPKDIVLRYYYNLCREEEAGKQALDERLPVFFQLPEKQERKYRRRLSEFIRSTAKDRKETWEKDEEIRALVEWAINLNDPAMKIAMLELLDQLADDHAVAILRRFALSRFQPDQLKFPAFGILARIGAKEPYLAYMEGKIVQGRVDAALRMDPSVPEEYREVFETLAKNILEDQDKNCLEAAIRYFERYLKALSPEYPKLNPQQIIAHAAAFEYLARKSLGLKVIKTKLAERYGISLLRLNNAISKILTVFQPDMVRI